MQRPRTSSPALFLVVVVASAACTAIVTPGGLPAEGDRDVLGTGAGGDDDVGGGDGIGDDDGDGDGDDGPQGDGDPTSSPGDGAGDRVDGGDAGDGEDAGDDDEPSEPDPDLGDGASGEEGPRRCGDAVCDLGHEDCVSCPGDCGACRNGCGNNRCTGGKTCVNCPDDCGTCTAPVCGDAACSGSETCTTCPQDCGACPPRCGDAQCTSGESCATCPEDCGGCICGDASCQGETCASCAADCGACPPTLCGNLVCEAGETTATCPIDCGAPEAQCDIDGVCDGPAGGEYCGSCGACSATLACSNALTVCVSGTCTGDCRTRDAYCGNGECQLGEDPGSCMADCGPELWPSPWVALEDEVLTLINQHRLAGTDCTMDDGTVEAKAPAPAVANATALRRAAQLHSWDMSYNRYFTHVSCNGRSYGTRVSAQGGTADAENIATGYSTASAVVAAWMKSYGHCRNIMGSHTLAGIGYARVPNSGARWTAVFR